MKSLKHIVVILFIFAISYMFGLAGSDGAADYKGIPLFIISGCFIFILHIAIFLPSYIYKTEHYFDLTGSLSYIGAIIFAWWFSPNKFNPANIVLVMLVIIWAVRLGSFLFLRVKKVGKDIRFDELKKNFFSFLMVWILSALWVYVTMSATLATVTSNTILEINTFFIMGLALWVLGFSIEAIADIQKYKFKCNPENEGRFITKGLWAWSRHPNYFGEITLWTGIAIMSFSGLSGYQYITMISPLFVWLLLTRISGIPMLEAKAKAQWGDDPGYKRYRDSTPVLILKPPHNRCN